MTLYVYHDFEHSELETLLNQALGPELIEIQELYYDQGRKWCYLFPFTIKNAEIISHFSFGNSLFPIEIFRKTEKILF